MDDVLSSVSFDSGLQRHKFGLAGVHYTPDGQLITGGDTVASFPRRETRYNDDYRSYDYRDRSQEQDRHYRSKPRSEPSRPNYGRKNRQGTGFDAPFERYPYDSRDRRIPRDRYDQYNTRDRDRYDRDRDRYTDRYNSRDRYERDRSQSRDISSHGGWNRQQADYHARSAGRDMYLDRRIELDDYKKPPMKDQPFALIFVINGILLLACAIVNVIICPDTHYYAAFWGGFVVLEFGIFGLLHKGDYRTPWKSWSYILLGCASTIVVFAGTALVFEKLIHDFVLLTTVDRTDHYILTFAGREANLDANITLETRTWLCFSFDCFIVTLFVFDYLILLAVMFVANRYWEVNYKVSKKCEPWCQPTWFNPFGQLPLAEAIAFMGLLTVYGCQAGPTATQWHKYWAPVWAAVLIAIGGGWTAAAFKRPDKGPLVGSAMLFQVLGLGGTGAALGLTIVGMVENIKVLADDKWNYTDTTTLTDDQTELVTASAVLYGITAGILLINVFFSFVLLVRLGSDLCSDDQPYRKRGRDQWEEESKSTYSYRDSSPRHGYVYNTRDRYKPPEARQYTASYFGGGNNRGWRY